MSIAETAGTLIDVDCSTSGCSIYVTTESPPPHQTPDWLVPRKTVDGEELEIVDGLLMERTHPLPHTLPPYARHGHIVATTACDCDAKWMNDSNGNCTFTLINVDLGRCIFRARKEHNCMPVSIGPRHQCGQRHGLAIPSGCPATRHARHRKIQLEIEVVLEALE